RKFPAPVQLPCRTLQKQDAKELSARVAQCRERHRRMLEKADQQGRSERRAEEVQTALRVGRSPLEWILANGKTPSALPTSENLFSVRRGSERSESAAGGLFQHCDKGLHEESDVCVHH